MLLNFWKKLPGHDSLQPLVSQQGLPAGSSQVLMETETNGPDFSMGSSMLTLDYLSQRTAA